MIDDINIYPYKIFLNLGFEVDTETINTHPLYLQIISDCFPFLHKQPSEPVITTVLSLKSIFTP